LEQNVDVVVVGAGIPSLALATQLRDHGIRPLLLDARRNVDSVPRGLTLQPNGLDAVEQLGLLDDTLKLGKPVQIFEIRDWTGKLLLDADYSLLDDPHNYLITINGTELELMLRYQAERKGVEVFWGAKFKELIRDSSGKPSGVVVESDKGESRISANLIVGADGAQSRIRTAMGSKTRIHKYEDSFIVGLVGPVSGLNGHARQYQAPHHMLGVMPLADQATFVHHCVGPRSFDELKNLGLAKFRAEVTSTAPELEQAFTNIENWNKFGYFMPSYVRVDDWVADNLALLGDSAHTLHPHSGQGLNLSLQDALALARVIEQCHQTNDYSATALGAYQTERKQVSDVIGEHAHYSATYALSSNWLVQRLNRRAMKRLQKNRELLKTALEVTAGVFKKKPNIVQLARIGGIIP
jgi:2-polyprenyl-6-methoxyphenol hydroxylase-like FAD-dependent oxidoreductase